MVLQTNKTDKMWKLSTKNLDLSENFKVRGSIYEALYVGGLAFLLNLDRSKLRNGGRHLRLAAAKRQAESVA